MDREDAHFTTRLAQSERDLRAAERLRYAVFVEELGGDGDLVDHAGRFERDRFDPHFRHLILVDNRRNAEALDHVVGVYRLLDGVGAAAAGQYYSEEEYDLSVLRASGRKLLELGRSCLHSEYRGGMAMYHIWNALAGIVAEEEIDVLFGVASFHGTDTSAHAEALSLLHHQHLAPEDLRVRARAEHFEAIDLVPDAEIDRVAAMRGVPALIKAYLRLGGVIGEGAFVDRPFNTIDVCLLLDTSRMNQRAAARYQASRG
ncbi:MAG: GNAT family N-acetyltransferase [Boseongicola sp.]|nr:GNAT family N-acetyltransferase [Boseongicola sp.]NNL19026.1 GNAT family N-acetyltransferase [Boseongicola sp.]